MQQVQMLQAFSFIFPSFITTKKKNFHLQQQRNGNAADCRLTHKNQERHIEEVKITNIFFLFWQKTIEGRAIDKSSAEESQMKNCDK